MARNQINYIDMLVLGVSFGKAVGYQEHQDEGAGICFLGPRFNEDGASILSDSFNKLRDKQANAPASLADIDAISFDFYKGTVVVHWQGRRSEIGDQMDASLKLDYAQLHKIRNTAHPED